MLAVFFGTVCLCKSLSAFCDGICDFRGPPGFSRAVDAAERNAEVAASLRSLVKVWVASERESVVKLEGVGQWVTGYQYK